MDYSLDLRVIQPGETVSLGSQSFTAIPTPHDSAQSCCYRVEQGDQTVMVCTDLGQMTPEIHHALSGCDTVLLESNYDEELMAHSPYPYFLRRRIVGSRGHLSNTDCANELVELAKTGVKRFVLGHLSQENNRPELAYQNALSALLGAGAVAGGRLFPVGSPPDEQRPDCVHGGNGMYRVWLICVGSCKEKHWREAVAEYQKRLSGFCKFTLVEVPEYRLPGDPSPAPDSKRTGGGGQGPAGQMSRRGGEDSPVH